MSVACRMLRIYTVGHRANIFVCDFVKNQQICMQFLLLDLQMNDTRDSINLIHITLLVLLHYLVKVKALEM